MFSVLYVDDEQDLLELGRLFLEKTGEFCVTTSISAQESLESPSILSYDAIISDYQMDGMNGIAFLKAVREQSGDIPFILFTGRGREEVVIDAINHGADFYLQKGGDPKAQFAELAHKIRQSIRRKQAERSLQESEQRLSDIINFLPDATFAIDRSGRVIAWNRAIEEMTGIPAGNMLGKGEYEYAVPFYGSRRRVLIDLIDEPDEKIAGFYPDTYRTGNSLSAENDLLLPNGQRLSVLARAGPLYNLSGEITGAIESIRDITARKRSEAALQQVSSELQLIFQNMINAFIIWESVFDEHGSYVSFRFGQFNDAYARMAKLRFEDVQGKDVFEIWPATEQSWVEVYGSVATTGIPRVFDMYHEPTKGWYHCNAYRPTASTAQICVIFEDITKRQHAEMELRTAYDQITAAEEELRDKYDELAQSEQRIRESEEKYRDLVENANSIILKWDKSGTITFFNEYAQGFFGYTRDEIIGKSVMGTIVPATESESDRDLGHMIDEIISHPEDHIFNENENITRDKKRVWIRWQNKILWDEKGQFAGLFSIGTDITERKRAERALQESEKRYRDMFELNNAVMLIIDPETGRIMDANSAASRYYGYSREEFSTLAITDINIADPEVIRKNMSRAAEHHGAVFSFRHRKKNGEIRDVDVFSASIITGGRHLLHSIVQDVTERKQAEEALRQANRKLNLLSGITRHDIRNQLLILSGYLELSKKTLGDPARTSDFIAKEEKVAESIAHQISFTKDYEDLGVHAPVWQNVNKIMQDVMTHLPMHHIRVDAGDYGLEVFADPLLEKVFYNLIDNALRYGGEKMTAIRMISHKENGILIIAVEDDGNGISTEEKKQLFTRGFGRHTGLGLYLSREILSITGITITENGEPGKGARFEIAVPDGGYRFSSR